MFTSYGACGNLLNIYVFYLAYYFCVLILYAVEGGEYCGDSEQRNTTFSKLQRDWGEESNERRKLRKGPFLTEDS